MTTLDGVLRRDGEHHAVRFEREYPTDPADLWAALTTPERVARWLDPVSGDLRVGGEVTVHFDDGDARLEVLACEPPRELTTRWLGDPPSQVSVTLTAVGAGRTRLLLDHVDLAERAATGYAAGWHWHLDALGALVGGPAVASWDDAFPALLDGYARQPVAG